MTASVVRGIAPWIAGALAILAASSALPQGNIDAGKSPAQLFADTCSNCHRRPQEVRRASASFLRQHYTPGSQEAAAMASYLAALPADPRAAKDGKDRAKASQEKDKAKAPAPVQQQAQDRAQDRVQERPQERPKAQPPQKGKRPEIGKSESAETPPETHVEAVVPKLEPFEE